LSRSDLLAAASDCGELSAAIAATGIKSIEENAKVSKERRNAISMEGIIEQK
jgi:hypothetical protein